mgnify:CR=1 FL=1
MPTTSKNIFFYIIKSGPLLLMYILALSELETEFNSYLNFFSFNLQMIIIYFWVLKKPQLLGNGHIFIAGIINDAVIGLPLGASAISFLVLSLASSYVRNATLRSRLVVNWFAFIPAIFFSNLIYLIIITKFSDISISYMQLLQNSFFTFLFFPIFYQIFDNYLKITEGSDD